MGNQRDVPALPPLRVGFISPVPSSDPDALSGMPCAMRLALESRGLEIVPLDRPHAKPGRKIVPQRIRRRLPAVAKQAWRTARQRFAERVEWSASGRCERLSLLHARRRADLLSERIRREAPDVLFGCCISSMLFGLQTTAPIVYFSDATARIINETYPAYQSRSPGYKRACDAYERETMALVKFAAFASEHARSSAVREYGLEHHRSSVVPMGAHVLPCAGHAERRLPSRGELRICMIASDPVRKQVGVAVRTTEELNARGWRATLTHVGRPCREALRSPLVRSLGPLRLSHPSDRALVARTLAASHVMILPSLGEAFGIAPCEAAHFGTPSVVSAAGGLPEVVEHGRTGIVLDVLATATNYAEAIADLAEDLPRYRRLSLAGIDRARTRFSWEVWAEGIVPLLQRAAGRGTARESSGGGEPMVRLAPSLAAAAGWGPAQSVDIN